jgi:hypothetical protein
MGVLIKVYAKSLEWHRCSRLVNFTRQGFRPSEPKKTALQLDNKPTAHERMICLADEA